MILANKILQNVKKHKISKNTIYKSKTSKFDGKIIECDSFPSPIGTICQIECNDNTQATEKL